MGHYQRIGVRRAGLMGLWRWLFRRNWRPPRFGGVDHLDEHLLRDIGLDTPETPRRARIGADH